MSTDRSLLMVALTGALLLLAGPAAAQITGNSIDYSERWQQGVVASGHTPFFSINVNNPNDFRQTYQAGVHDSRPSQYTTTRDRIDAVVLCPVSGHCGPQNRAQWAQRNVSEVRLNGQVIGTVAHNGKDVVRVPLSSPLQPGRNHLVFRQYDPRTGAGTTATGFIAGREAIIDRVVGQQNSGLRGRYASQRRWSPRGCHLTPDRR